MTFNPGQTKQAQELTFSRKTNKIVLPPLSFNNATVKKHYWPSTREQTLIQRTYQQQNQ